MFYAQSVYGLVSLICYLLELNLIMFLQYFWSVSQLNPKEKLSFSFHTYTGILYLLFSTFPRKFLVSLLFQLKTQCTNQTSSTTFTDLIPASEDLLTSVSASDF